MEKMFYVLINILISGLGSVKTISEPSAAARTDVGPSAAASSSNEHKKVKLIKNSLTKFLPVCRTF